MRSSLAGRKFDVMKTKKSWNVEEKDYHITDNKETFLPFFLIDI